MTAVHMDETFATALRHLLVEQVAGTSRRDSWFSGAGRRIAGTRAPWTHAAARGAHRNPQPSKGSLNAMPVKLRADSTAPSGAIGHRAGRRRVGKFPVIVALGAIGAAATVAAIVSLGSSAAPAFAGWQATPSAPAPGQLARAQQACGQDLGSPVLTDSRGPYTAALYADSSTSDVCLSGNGVSMSSRSTSVALESVAAGQIELNAAGKEDSAGNALTLVDGRTGAGVTAVRIERRDASSVQATVAGGWYLAWWPGSASPTNAKVTTASGTSTEPFSSARLGHECPPGGTCEWFSDRKRGSAPTAGREAQHPAARARQPRLRRQRCPLAGHAEGSGLA